MTTAVSQYLENVRGKIRVGRSEEREILSELETHIEDGLQELRESGLSEEEASKTCLGLLGSARLVARQIYEAHSQGTWKQALLAAMPHLLFALIFTLNWWRDMGWLSLLLVLTLTVVIYGWWHGKPAWVFPWLGYSLIPVLAFGLLLVYLPRGWSLLTIPLYYPLALWWLYFIVVQTTRRDWLFSSLMLLPLPIIIGWFLTVAPYGRFNDLSIQRLHNFAPWIGLSFLVLALTIATFIRLRQRWLRIALLIVGGALTLTVVAYYTSGELNLPTLLGLILVMWGLFIVPPLLERLVRNGKYVIT